jgi:hypothetical protein
MSSYDPPAPTAADSAEAEIVKRFTDAMLPPKPPLIVSGWQIAGSSADAVFNSLTGHLRAAVMIPKGTIINTTHVTFDAQEHISGTIQIDDR